MKFIVERDIFEKYPDTIIGVVFAHGVNNEGGDREISSLLREEEARIKASFEAETRRASWLNLLENIVEGRNRLRF